MNQNKQFDNILSECLDRLFKGETIEQCLNRYPEQARELEPLLRTVQVAKKASNVQPRPEFKAQARYQFQAALRDMETKKQRKSFFNWLPQWRWQSGWSMAIIAALIIVLGGGGTVIASSSSMPDSALYSVKLATEKVQLAVTPSDLGKAELNAKFANRRTEEINYLVTLNDAQEVQNVAMLLNTNLENMTVLAGGGAATDYGTQRAYDGPTATNNAEMFTNTQNAPQPMLGVASAPAGAPDSPVSKAAPQATSQPGNSTSAPAQDVSVPTPMIVISSEGTSGGTGDASMDTSKPTSRNAYEVNGTAQDSSTELTKQDKIRQIIEENYLTCRSTLENALENASPEVRPAIRQAIAKIEMEYYRALSLLDAAANNP